MARPRELDNPSDETEQHHEPNDKRIRESSSGNCLQPALATHARGRFQFISPMTTVRQLQTRFLLLLVGITLAVFAGVSGHEFVHYDDNINIYENPHLKGLSWDSIQWMFTDTSYARRYMPLGWLCYAVDYQIFGLDPRAFHIGNLFFHLLNVGLLFVLIQRLLRLTRQFDASDPAPVWCAAAGALFWAVNPLRVENVAWASSRIYCVAFLLALIWLLAWLRAHDPATAVSWRPFFYWSSVAAFAASLLTYPLALFAPIALFVLEVYPLRRVGGQVSDWFRPKALRVWRDKIPFLLLAAGGLALTVWARGAHSQYNQPVTLKEFDLFSRAVQALYIWAYYIWKPWAPFELAPSYVTLHAFDPFALPFLLSAALVVAVTVALWRLRHRWPAALALWFCHLLLLVPFLGLTEYSHSPSDRYSYVQGILWSVAVALMVRVLWNQPKRALLTGTVVAAASLMFGLLAWQQVAVWRDTITLHRHLLTCLGEHPYRARFDEVLGVHYLRAGLTNEAVASFRNAIRYELRRSDRHIVDEDVLSRSHAKLGDVFAEQARAEEALGHYRAALKANSGSVHAAVNMGLVLASLNRYAEAATCFEQAIRNKPASASAHHNLALTLNRMGKKDEAQQHLQQARRLAGKR